MKELNNRLLLIGILSISILYGCSLSRDTMKTSTPSINISDGGLISKEPCGPPCFWGITPGESNKEQAYKIINSKVDINLCTSWDTRDQGGDYGIRCEDVFGLTFNDQGKVCSIGIKPSISIFVSDVINQFGNPDAIKVSILGLHNNPPFTMMLFYEKWKMRIDLYEQETSYYEIQPINQIEGVLYLDQTSYRASLKSYQLWQGYGKYSNVSKIE
jgi:hypothetical protein